MAMQRRSPSPSPSPSSGCSSIRSCERPESDRGKGRSGVGGVGSPALRSPFQRPPPSPGGPLQDPRRLCPLPHQPLSRPHHRRPHRWEERGFAHDEAERGGVGGVPGRDGGRGEAERPR